MKRNPFTTRTVAFVAVLSILLTSTPKAAEPPSRQTSAARLWGELSQSAKKDIRSQDALKKFSSFIEAFPADARGTAVHYALAEQSFQQRKFEVAAVGFEKFLKTYPSHLLADSAAYRLGECYDALKVPQSAAIAWKRVVDNHPDSALWHDALIRLSMIALARGAWGEADEYLKQLRSKRETVAAQEGVREIQGIIDFHLGNYTQSVNNLQGLELDSAAYFRGLSYFALKLYTESSDALKSLPARGPAVYKESAAFLKAESFFQGKNYTLASREFQDYLKDHPNTPLSAYAKIRLAACHLLIGEPAEALRWVRQAQGPSVPSKVRPYGDFIEGAAQLARGELGPAARSFGQAAVGGPADLTSAALIRKAWAHHLLNEDAAVEAALTDLQKANPGPQDLALAQFLRGARLFEKKKWEDAGALFESGVLSYPYSDLSEIQLALMTQAYTQADRSDHLVTAANSALKILSGNFSSASGFWRGQSHFFIGNAYFNLKRYKEAQEHFSLVLSHYTGHPLAQRSELLLAWCMEEAGQHDKARAAAQRIIDDKKADKTLATHAAFLDAVTYFNQKNYDKSLGRLAAFVEEHPKSELTPEAQYLLGLGYHQKEVFGSAIDQWQILIRRFPENNLSRLAYLHIGDLYFKAGKFQEAATFLREFQTRWPKDAEFGERALWKEVQALFNGSDNEAAIEGYRRYLAAYPSGPNAPDAEKQLEMVYYRRGEQGDPAKIEEFLSLYPASPFAPSARYRLGAMAMEQSKWQRAVIEFEQFARDYPKDQLVADAYIAAGQAYESLGDQEKAQLKYQALLDQFKLTPQALDAAFRLGALHFKKERFKESAEAFEFAAQRRLSDQQKANVHYNLALCYENLARPADAALNYGLFARYTPDAQAAREAELSSGLLYKKTGDHPKAEASFRKLLKRSDLSEEERLQAVNLLAETQLAAGQQKKGMKTYEDLIGLGPAAHDLRLAGLAQLAFFYEKEGNLISAVRVYEKIAVSGGKAEWVKAAEERVTALTAQMAVVP